MAQFRIIERHDPGHQGTNIRVNLDHIAVYAAYAPKEAGGKVIEDYSTIVMSNGMVILGKITVKTLDDIFKVNKK